MDWAKIISTAIKSAAKDAIWFYRLLGFNTLADKTEQRIDQWSESQVNGEDTSQANVIKWVVRILLIGGFLTIMLKIKSLIINR